MNSSSRATIRGAGSKPGQRATRGPLAMTEPQQIELTFTVRNQAQALELDAAWRAIIHGQKMEYARALETGLEQVMERARPALEVIESAIRENPTTGQAGRLVRFLAAIYNGYDYDFDLTDLRALDTRLANACLDYLNYDRLGKQEVHKHLSGGDRELQRWIRDYRLAPRLTLDDRQTQAFAELVERADRSPNELLREAIADLLDKYSRKAAAATKR